MKILKYVGIVACVLVVVLFSIGAFVSPFRYSVKVLINATPEKCWAVLHDSSRMKHWIPGFQRLTLLSGEAMSAGAVYEIHILQEELYIMKEILKEVKAPVLASYTLTNDVMQSNYVFTLLSQESQTEISCGYEISGNGILWKSLLFYSKSYLEQQAQEQLNLLKQEVEKEYVNQASLPEDRRWLANARMPKPT